MNILPRDWKTVGLYALMAVGFYMTIAAGQVAFNAGAEAARADRAAAQATVLGPAQ